MIIKKVTPETEYLADFTSAVAFEYGTDYIKSKEESEKRLSEPEPEKRAEDNHEPKAVRWGAFTDDMSECMATVWSTPYTVRFDRRTILMGGIGGVACLPHHRDKGAVKAIMREMLADDYRRGITYDYLYPFSRAYYRQYGFENAVERRTYEIPFDALRALIREKAAGSFYMIRPDMDYSVLDTVSARAFQEINLSTCWLRPSQTLKKSGGADKMNYIYVYADEAGTPRGYVAFTGRNGVMNCVNDFGHPAGFVFDGADTLRQMLRFCARMFSSRYNTLKITLPGYVRIETIIPEMNSVSASVDTQGMIRIINLDSVLRSMLYKGSGEITISVDDPVIKENSGCRLIKWRDDKFVSAELFGSEPDIECGIGELSLLTSGAVRTEEIRWLSGVKVNNPYADLSGIFYFKESYVTSLF